jgi:hypothetical protein
MPNAFCVSRLYPNKEAQIIASATFFCFGDERSINLSTQPGGLSRRTDRSGRRHKNGANTWSPARRIRVRALRYEPGSGNSGGSRSIGANQGIERAVRLHEPLSDSHPPRGSMPETRTSPILLNGGRPPEG